MAKIARARRNAGQIEALQAEIARLVAENAQLRKQLTPKGAGK